VSPLAIGASTMAIGGALLYLTARRGANGVFRDRGTWRWLLAGGISVFAYPLAFYSSMNLAGVAIGTVVTLGTAPLFAALIELVYDHRRPSTSWIIGTSVAVVGLVLLATAGTEHTTSGGSAVVGVVLGLIAGLAYAIYTYASTRLISIGHSSSASMGALTGVGAVLLLPVLIALGAPLLQSWQSVGIMAYLAIGPMFIAYLFFGAGLATVTSARATTITLIEPVFATVLAVLVVGERLSLLGWIGLALVIIGVTPVVAARRPQK
jgi:DME family drug/metabolite transporter